jgi:hypothetical protein
MSTDFPRRWSATITYADEYMDLCVRPARGQVVDADQPSSDLQKSMLISAYAEAAQFLLMGEAKHARIQLFKTTKAHGTVSDKSEMLDVQDAEKWALRTIEKNLDLR